MNYLLGYLILYSSNVQVLFTKEGMGVKMESRLEGESLFMMGNPPYHLSTWQVVLTLGAFFGLGMLLVILWGKFNKKRILGLTAQPPKPSPSGEDPIPFVWDSIEDGLLLSTEEGEIVAINPNLCKMAGFSAPQEIQHKKIGELFENLHFADFYQSLVLPGIEDSHGKGYSVELKIPFMSGARDIELFANKINRNDKEKRIILSLFREISGRRDFEQGKNHGKEKPEEAQKLKTSFLSNMSHEIRTPLNGILGSTANIILRNSHNPELVSQLEIIMQSGERLLDTINNILDMSRIEANKMEILLEEININDFLSKLLMPLKSLAIQKGLLLTAKYETKPFIGKIDKKYFELIVNNIVGNAIKYSDCGLIEVRLKKEEGQLLLYVQDKGIGISEKYLEKLFNPFEQESVGYDREFEGSGLGLTITKNLIDLLSGEIRITSQKGQGTVVSIVLPLI